MSLERCGEGFPITSLQEIRLLSRLRHKNVVRLIEVACARYSPPEQLLGRQATAPFNYPWNFFMVCEYMDHSLRGIMERGINLTVSQIKYTMLQVLEGMAHLHSQGVMHRDVKCSNILMNSQGEIKLADLGMGTTFRPGKPVDGPKTVVTLWYRAPELLRGARYTQAIDLWAVGCVFAELLKGEALFKGRGEEEQLRMILAVVGEGSKVTQGLKEKLANSRFESRDNERNRADDIALDLLAKLLQLDPRARLSAKEAMEHEYFRVSPEACPQEGMPRLTGDSHEYLLRIQQANRSLMELSASTSATRGKSTVKATKRPLAGAGEDRKMSLFGRDESVLLEPSTKESASVK